MCKMIILNTKLQKNIKISEGNMRFFHYIYGKCANSSHF